MNGWVLGTKYESILEAGLVRLVAGVLLHALLSDQALLVREAARVVGEVGQDEKGKDGDENGDGALDVAISVGGRGGQRRILLTRE
jgi:hypothetical protein